MGKHKLYGEKLERARRMYALDVPADQIAKELRVKKWRVYATVGLESRLAAKELARIRNAADRRASDLARRETEAPATEPTMADLLRAPMPSADEIRKQRLRAPKLNKARRY